jgi:hypothetical protein
MRGFGGIDAGATIARWFLAVAIGLSVTPVRAQIEMCSGTATNPSQPCYRYFCNSMSAEGSVEEDGCDAPCDDENATRWGATTIGVKVDDDTVPSGISTADWATVSEDALATWSSVSGASLTFQTVGDADNRTFGEDDDSHEIFWITSQTEFMEKVGQGINSVLGVTSSRYFFCEPRIIEDADLVMNGVPAADISWVPTLDDCGEFDWCESVYSTMLHELGHFLGLGHPCSTSDCIDWSIMAAQSWGHIFSVEY